MTFSGVMQVKRHFLLNVCLLLLDTQSLDSDRYCIIGADLRDISTLDEKLKKFHLNPE